MRRRVAQGFRIGLAGLGVLLLLWMPVSYFAFLWLKVPLPGNYYTGTYLSWGRIRFVAVKTGSILAEPPEQISIGRITDTDAERQRTLMAYGRASYPAAAGGAMIWVHVPIWSISALCLAWPVTSFIIARRRGKRGFPISLAPFPSGDVPGEAGKRERESMSKSAS